MRDLPETLRTIDPRPWHTVTLVSGPSAAAAVAAWTTARGRACLPLRIDAHGDLSLAALLAGLCAAGAPLDAGVVAVARYRPPLDTLFGRVVRPALAQMAETDRPVSVHITLDAPPSPEAKRILTLLVGEIDRPHHVFVVGGDDSLFEGLSVAYHEVRAQADLDGARDAIEPTDMPSDRHGIDGIDAIGALTPGAPAWPAWQRLRRGDAHLAARMAAPLGADPAAREVEAAACFSLAEDHTPLAPSPPIDALARARHADPRTLDRLVAAADTAGWGWSPIAARIRWARARTAWRYGALGAALIDADAAALRATLVGDMGLAVEARALAALVRAAQADREGAIGAARLAEHHAGPWPPARIAETLAAMMTRVARLLGLPPMRRPPRAPETDDGRWAAALARLDADPTAAIDPGDDPAWTLLAAIPALVRGDRAPLDAAIAACRAVGVRGPLIELAGLIEALGGPALPEATRPCRPARAAPAPSRPLSPRETEALTLAARGLRNREIAETLGIATSTVGIHLRNAYDKLGVRCRAAAIRAGQALGII